MSEGKPESWGKLEDLFEKAAREREEKKEELRKRLIWLKATLEEVEEKSRICYLEVVEMLVEVDKE